jgi:tetratricopeptide (TPR) repeat protein
MKKQAEALLRSSKLREAKELYRQICQADPRDINAWFVLGAVNGWLGDYGEAEACCRKAIDIQPNLPEAHFNLGMALKDLGRAEEAVVCFREAVRIKPDYADAHNALGYVQNAMGAVAEAAENFRLAIRLKPRHPEALNNLGNLLRDQNDLDEAVTCYQRALDAAPAYADAWINLGNVLSENGRLEEAASCFQRVLRLQPNHAEMHYHLGNALFGMSRLDEAIASFRRAQQIKPGYADALGAEALALQKQGKYSEAYQRIMPMIDAGTENPSIAVAFAYLSARVDRQADAIALVEQLLAKNNLADEQRQKLHFALGKSYDAKDLYEKAFEQFRLANSFYRTCFDRAKHDDLIRGLMETYSREAKSHLPRASTRSSRPVFIVGMPRSGTSLAEQILASHPAVFGAGELNTINRMTASLPARLGTSVGYPQCVAGLTQEQVNALAQEYLKTLDQFSTSATRVTDKMPHNHLHLGLIEQLFPDARIIHCLRHPLDTCLSIYSQHFTFHAYAHDLENLGYYYRRYLELMQFWRETINLPMFEFRYEEAVAEPERWIRSLVAFCGLDWDDNCLRFYETSRTVNTPSSEQVRKPMYTSSVGRWKHYEAFLRPLTAALEEK